MGKQVDEFKRGATVAICVLNALHDVPEICADALENLDITKKDCATFDLTEADQVELKAIWSTR